jgi:hypothetical protein
VTRPNFNEKDTCGSSFTRPVFSISLFTRSNTCVIRLVCPLRSANAAEAAISLRVFASMLLLGHSSTKARRTSATVFFNFPSRRNITHVKSLATGRLILARIELSEPLFSHQRIIVTMKQGLPLITRLVTWSFYPIILVYNVRRIKSRRTILSPPPAVPPSLSLILVSYFSAEKA